MSLPMKQQYELLRAKALARRARVLQKQENIQRLLDRFAGVAALREFSSASLGPDEDGRRVRGVLDVNGKRYSFGVVASSTEEGLLLGIDEVYDRVNAEIPF